MDRVDALTAVIAACRCTLPSLRSVTVLPRVLLDGCMALSGGLLHGAAHRTLARLTAGAAAAALSSRVGQSAACRHPFSQPLLMSTAAVDRSSEGVRTDNSAAAAQPASAFLWSGYRLPYSSVPPSPLPDFYSLSSWPADPMRAFVWWYREAEAHYGSLLHEAGGSAQRAVHWPNNMQLATADSSGQPHARNVLLKGADGRGLVFFTNRQGAKGRQLAANGRAAAVFYWKGLERQVRVEGDVCEVSDDESDGYFHSRPVGSQVSAAVSPQSSSIHSRAALEEHYVDQLDRATRAAVDGAEDSSARPHSIHVQQLPHGHSHSAQPSASDAHSHHQHALQSLARIQQQQHRASDILQHCIQRPGHWGGYRLVPRLFEFWEDGQYRLHSRVEYSRRGPAEGQAADSERQHQQTTAQSEWDKRFLAP